MSDTRDGGLDLTVSFRIDPNGEVHKLDAPKSGETYALDELQSMVEGYIETVYPSPFPDHVCFANEEGLLLGLPYNEKASELFDRDLVGRVACIRKECVS
jgi:hypothetical protein